MKQNIAQFYYTFIKQNIYFLLPVLCVFFVSSALYFLLGNINIHQTINQFTGTKNIDNFFAVITELGNGIVVFIFVLGFLFFDINTAIKLLLAFLLATVLVWLCKFLLFTHAGRPLQVFADAHLAINTISGIKTHMQRTFPSGHAATIFTIFSCLAFNSKKKFIKFNCFIGAIIIAFSRVYLSQHFLQDVAVGAVFATLSTAVVYAGMRKSYFYWKRSTNKKFPTQLAQIKK